MAEEGKIRYFWGKPSNQTKTKQNKKNATQTTTNVKQLSGHRRASWKAQWINGFSLLKM